MSETPPKKKPKLRCRLFGHAWRVISRKSHLAICRRCHAHGWEPKLEHAPVGGS